MQRFGSKRGLLLALPPAARRPPPTVEAGELRVDTGVPGFARHTLVCFTGALQVWAVDGWGSLRTLLTDQLDLTIAPHRPND